LILIEDLFEKRAPGFKKTPTGVRTVNHIQKKLAAQFNINVSVDTLIRDIKKIGTAKLRR
jgi:hypothetical protein